MTTTMCGPPLNGVGLCSDGWPTPMGLDKVIRSQMAGFELSDPPDRLPACGRPLSGNCRLYTFIHTF
jgi:hypothetical protein